MKKIVSIEVLEKIISKLKAKGKKVVLCHGVFDLLHIGHIKHFKEAKNQGDVLIVTLTPDKYVNKGPNRPAFQVSGGFVGTRSQTLHSHDTCRCHRLRS